MPDTLHYTPRSADPDAPCTHCGQLRELHHTDGRCYDAEELMRRLRHYQRTGAWPAPEAVRAVPKKARRKR
jgi:hypothetical protein